MQSVQTQNTGPELVLRKLLAKLGFRYRLHRRDLPGSPDIVFPGRRKVIFVHGCFWHGHRCAKGRLPKSRLDYWEPKIAANRKRDSKNEKALEALGWKSLTIWQCQMSDLNSLKSHALRFLGVYRKFRSTS